MKDILKRIEHQLAYIEEIRNSARTEERKAELIESAEGVIERIRSEFNEHRKHTHCVLVLGNDSGPGLISLRRLLGDVKLENGDLPRTKLNLKIEPLPIYDPKPVVKEKHNPYTQEQNKLRARHSHKKR